MKRCLMVAWLALAAARAQGGSIVGDHHLFHLNLTPLNAVADWDGDGDPDILADTSGFIIISPAVRGFNFTSIIIPYKLSYWAPLGVDDYDGDGRPDLLFYQGTKLNWYVNRSPSTTWPTVVADQNIALISYDSEFIDLDGDGWKDIVTLRGGSFDPSAVWYRREPEFPARYTMKTLTWEKLRQLRVVDWDGDGDRDVVAIRTFDPDPSAPGPLEQHMIWLENKNSVFHFGQEQILAEFTAAQTTNTLWLTAAGDLDGDGDGDASYLLINPDTYRVREIGWIEQRAGEPVVFHVLEGSAALINDTGRFLLHDLDLDGDPEIIGPQGYWENVGKTAKRFEWRPFYDASNPLFYPYLCPPPLDMDLDGDPDLIVENGWIENLTIDRNGVDGWSWYR